MELDSPTTVASTSQIDSGVTIGDSSDDEDVTSYTTDPFIYPKPDDTASMGQQTALDDAILATLISEPSRVEVV